MSYTDYGAAPTSPGGMSTRRLTNRNTNRYSVTALFSMAAEQDVEVEDELGRGTSRQSRVAPDVLIYAYSGPVKRSPEAVAGAQGSYLCSI